MTKEEFAKIAMALQSYYPRYSLLPSKEAMEQETCEDAVSREAIVEMLNARVQGSVMTFDHFIELLYKLPPVTPTQNWIPVKERLPEESLNSVIGWDACRERCVFVQYIDGHFQITGRNESFDIQAWMPLPKGYVPDTNVGNMEETLSYADQDTMQPAT